MSAMSSTVPELIATVRSAGLVLDLVDAEPDSQGRRRDRTYRIHLQATLWGGVSVVREWGRRGRTRRPRRLVTHHPDAPEAVAELERVILRRLRRGYVPSLPGCGSPAGFRATAAQGQGGLIGPTYAR